MGNLSRFGVSIEKELLDAFDALCRQNGYANRSEAIRDLIRKAINEEQWGEQPICGGTLTLVYDHHRHDLARRIMSIQHDFHDVIVATMHIHLDHANCLECLALKGEAATVRKLAQKLVTCRGVKYGVFNRAPTGGDIA